MRLHQIWTSAALAATVLTGAAFAEVTVSQSNDPSALMGEQFASIMGIEKTATRAVPSRRLTEMVIGPKIKVKTTATAAPAKAKAGQPAAAAEEGAALAAAPAGKPGFDPSDFYSEAALMAMPAPGGDAEWQCLKTALYFEARGESLRGQFAVAEVILNRVDSPAYPGTVCGVVSQQGGGSCQFSFICDGAAEVMSEPYAAEIAGRIARVMLDGAARPLTAGATHFHTRAVRPHWSEVFSRTAAIGAHLFYRRH